MVKKQTHPKQVFTLNGEQYTTDESGNLIPFVEKLEIKTEVLPTVTTINEACKILKIGRNTIMDLINSGQLKAVKAEVKWLVPCGGLNDECLV